VFGDRTHPTPLIGCAFAWTKSQIVAHLPAVFETLHIDQFPGEQFVSEFAFAKEQLLPRRGRLELRFVFQRLLFGQLDELLSSSPADDAFFCGTSVCLFMVVECGVPLAHSTTHDIYNKRSERCSPKRRLRVSLHPHNRASIAGHF
jgi:hypothetical protein